MIRLWNIIVWEQWVGPVLTLAVKCTLYSGLAREGIYPDHWSQAALQEAAPDMQAMLDYVW